MVGPVTHAIVGYLHSGDRTSIHVPDEVTEAIRDLERARDDAKIAERVARHHLSKFLLRHGRIYPGKTSWNAPHRAWVAQQDFGPRGQSNDWSACSAKGCRRCSLF